MNDHYFFELHNLRFDPLPATDLPDDLRDALEGWVPREKGIFARLENRWMGKEQFDCVLITGDIIYCAILSHELQPRLLSLKCFKTAGMTAFAFILEPVAGGSSGTGEVPQVRLMMDDGKRVKLMLDPTQKAEAIHHLKALSAQNFFIC